MSKYQWFRRWRGGYWFFEYFNNWRRVTKRQYEDKVRERMGDPAWSFENYE